MTLRHVIGGWRLRIETPDTTETYFLPDPASRKDALKWAGYGPLAEHVRAHLNWTIEEMAHVMDVDIEDVVAWECGQARVPQDVVRCLHELVKG